MDNDWNAISGLDLKERDINLLQTINEEELTNFTFEGLKRRLKIHQETLSRILYRLTDQEILKKGINGYTLTSKAKKLLKSQPSDSNNPNLPLLQTFLPPQISIKKIVYNLKGKWFGNLRWLGYSVTNESITLKWITEDGGNIISENDLISALNAAHQLMSHITKLILKTGHN
jgi:hypothetical protein